MIAARHTAAWFPSYALDVLSKTHHAVYRFLPAGVLAMLYGPSSSGYKTFLIMSLLRACALGEPWQGRRTDPQTCILIAGEGGLDIHLRHAGLDQFHGAPSPILIDASRPQLDEKSGYWHAMALIYEATSARFEFAEIGDFSDAILDRRYWQESEHQELARLEAVEARLSRFVDWGADDGRYAGSPENLAYDAAHEACEVFEARTNAECVGRYSERDAIFHEVFSKGYAPHKAPSHGNVLMVIDTFAATAADDTRPTVAKYVRNLKALQEQIAAQGGCLTILFTDHTTKSEGTFQGSGSKFNDVDVVIEVHPKGQRRTLIACEKMKFFEPFAPMKFTMTPVTIDGYIDVTGAPLTTLVCVGDTDTPDAAEAAPKAPKPTASGLLMALIQNHGPIADGELRTMFFALPLMTTKKPDTQRTAYRRALESLQDDFSIEVENDVIRLAHDTE